MFAALVSSSRASPVTSSTRAGCASTAMPSGRLSKIVPHAPHHTAPTGSGAAVSAKVILKRVSAGCSHPASLRAAERSSRMLAPLALAERRRHVRLAQSLRVDEVRAERLVDVFARERDRRRRELARNASLRVCAELF